MKTFYPAMVSTNWIVRTAGVALALSLPLSARAESGVWKSKTSGPSRQLAVFFPTPSADSGSPQLVVLPLLGPERRLLPDGRMLIWVGRTDGTPLPNATVTVRVPEPGNPLASGGSRVIEVTVYTDADGIAEIKLTSPDVPPGNGGNGGGGGPVGS